MLALCLNLGNLTFKPGKEGSEVPDQKLLKKCAEALQVDAPMLQDALIFKTMGGGKLSTCAHSRPYTSRGDTWHALRPPLAT